MELILGLALLGLCLTLALAHNSQLAQQNEQLKNDLVAVIDAINQSNGQQSTGGSGVLTFLVVILLVVAFLVVGIPALALW